MPNTELPLPSSKLSADLHQLPAAQASQSAVACCASLSFSALCKMHSAKTPDHVRKSGLHTTVIIVGAVFEAELHCAKELRHFGVRRAHPRQ